jgi:hydroxymethylbilane synthase
MKNTIRIASRQSELAMWQSNHIASLIKQKYPSISVEVIGFKTQGDIILNQPLAEIGGKGLFIKELEQALLDGHADLAVHSMKDVPMDLPEPFKIAAIPLREDSSDAFVSTKFNSLDELPKQAIVGTSSLRRQSLLYHQKPDLQINSLRGNLQTRLKKLDDGFFDAIVLASAGLIRLGLSERIKERLNTSTYIPAVGQGALGIEILKDNKELSEFLNFLNDHPTEISVNTERIISRSLAGSCTVPIGAHAMVIKDTINLKAFVASPDGNKIIFAEDSGSINQNTLIAESVSKQLIKNGAKEVLGI